MTYQVIIEAPAQADLSELAKIMETVAGTGVDGPA